MGLFEKREPCAICGGKVKALLPWTVDGRLICNNCYGQVDLPGGTAENMSFEEFRQYLAFRKENAMLKNRFQVSLEVDFGWFDTKFLIDTHNCLLCMDKNLDKTIFEGRHIKSFVIREDASPLFEGSAAGLICHNSSVADWAMAVAPQINQYRLQREMQDYLNRGYNNNSSTPYIDIPEPFKEFIVEIQFEHPYWTFFSADMNGPEFNNSAPDINNYLSCYRQDVQLMKQFATALRDISFPNAPIQQDTPTSQAAAYYGGNAPATGVDTVEEIRRFKALMDQGIIMEEEFAAKKTQLLGI